MGDSIGEKVKRWRELSREPWVHVGAHCQALSEAADECERKDARICELESIQRERLTTALTMQNRIRRLEEALRWYADGDNYAWIDHSAEWAPVIRNNGDRARRALAEDPS